MLEDLFYYETPKWSHKAHALQTYSCHEIRNMWTRQSSRWSLLSDFQICFQRGTWELSSIYHEIGKKQRRCRQDKFSLIDMSKQHMVIRTSFWGATQRSRNTILLHHRKLLKNCRFWYMVSLCIPGRDQPGFWDYKFETLISFRNETGFLHHLP